MREVIAVLRGGPSNEYDVSLMTGASVLGALNQEKYESRDIFVSREGQWHLHGLPVSPERALRGVDVALNAMHGEYGENGEVQALLDALSVPYTGSNASSSAIAFNKYRTKKAMDALGVKVAHGTVVDSNKITDLEKTALNIFRSLPHPLIVKPTIGGSSIGVSMVDSFHSLEEALEKAFSVSPRAVVEEYIKGRDATIGVIEQFRGEKLYALLPTEIILPPAASFYDYGAKYGGGSQLRTPGNFSKETKEQLQRIARQVHEGLNLSHYSRSDFVVSKRGIYFLEVNTLSDLGEKTEFSHMLNAVGVSLSHFLDHIISLAKKRHV